MWSAEDGKPVVLTDQCNWSALIEKIVKHGVRNNLLTAQIPTASTAQILGNNESPTHLQHLQSPCPLIDFQIVNPHLLKDLIDLNLWDDKLKNEMNGRSIQGITNIPMDL
ncbi:hypothetical protein L596_006571 [Steinernema carpocapsae]|uniref:Ribonucleotide reductase large subunit domain-containing protein n=1 Tax=Steinernema carpocapsae TaxID=34508 RepID=A0A4V6I919_STECR|nr:hypothetical protein L596_006571 [Steinernema carpocapsae]